MVLLQKDPLQRAPGTIAAIVIICLSVLLTLTLGKNVGCCTAEVQVPVTAAPLVSVFSSGTSDAGTSGGCEEDRCPFPPN